jgi:hypothetical protein
MAGLAIFFFALLLASGTVTATNPALAVQANNQQASSPQAATHEQVPSKPASPRPNPDASGKYHVGDGVTAPKLIYSVEPEFSENCARGKLPEAALSAL